MSLVDKLGVFELMGEAKLVTDAEDVLFKP